MDSHLFLWAENNVNSTAVFGCSRKKEVGGKMGMVYKLVSLHFVLKSSDLFWKRLSILEYVCNFK